MGMQTLTFNCFDSLVLKRPLKEKLATAVRENKPLTGKLQDERVQMLGLTA